MKISLLQHSFRRAYSLIEVVIAIGVLAVAVPLVFASLGQAGKIGMSSKVETRCSWIVPTCIQEIRASRAGHPQFFDSTSAGEVFPPPGDAWVLAFASDGSLIGKVPKILHENGLKEIDGKPVIYLASLSAARPINEFNQVNMIDVKISILYPAAVPEKRRNKLDFFSRIL